jgi:multimeric flavodoxin WrbA
MTNTSDRPETLSTGQRVLLACGALSTVLYVAMNVFVPMQWESYSSVSQTISELSAIGAPTRSLWIPFGALYAVLVTAFGWGVWTTARGNRPLRVVGVLMLVYGLSGFAWFFAPMHLRGNTATLTDVMHLVLGGATSLLYMLALGFGAAALGKRFRLYSLATMAVLVMTGILTGLEAPGIGQNLPTPWIGVWERMSLGAAMLWLAVLSVALLRARWEAAPLASGDAPRATEKKKVTAFVGCGSRKHTYEAVRRFADHLQVRGDVEVEIVRLGEHRIETCRGCKVCFQRGEEHCPLKDDRDVLIRKMVESDGVVFASPNYSFQVSAMMKLFLDRLGYAFHRPQFFGKTCSSIVVQGIYGGEKIVKYLDLVGFGLGFDVVKGSCFKAFDPMTEAESRKLDASLVEQSRRFHESLRRRPHAVPSLIRLFMFRYARSSIRIELDERSRDFVYYRDNGWFESDYYHPVRLGATKRTIGRWLDTYFTRAARKRLASSFASSRPADAGVGA